MLQYMMLFFKNNNNNVTVAYFPYLYHLKTGKQMLQQSMKDACFLRVLHKDNPSLFTELLFGIHHATVCLSPLITGNQDSGGGVYL